MGFFPPSNAEPDKRVIPNMATGWQQRPGENAEAVAATVWQTGEVPGGFR